MTLAGGASTNAEERFLVGAARAFGGAIIFALPMLMTMEMWRLGFTIEPERLLILLVIAVPFLIGLSHYSGYEDTFDLAEDAVDAFVAYAIGFICSAAMLALFGVLERGQSLREVVGKVSLNALPASMGALLAQSQFGGSHEAREARDEHKRPSTYASQLFVMAAGALFLAFNIAPTEEVQRIGALMTPLQALGLVALSLLAMHAFVYAAEFRGQHDIAEHESGWTVFFRFTVVGFVIALAISGYVLWTFGRLDGLPLTEALTLAVVLAFPGAIGAAAARLIL